MEDSAATAIQAIWRRRWDHARFVQQLHARQVAARKLSRRVRTRRMCHAATRIQAVQRGHSDRITVRARERSFRPGDWDDDDDDVTASWCRRVVTQCETCCGVLSAEPHVAVADGFLSPTECGELIACASARRP